MVAGAQVLGIDELVGERRVLAAHAAEQAVGAVGDLLLAAVAVGHHHVALEAEAEHRLQARGDVVGEDRDRAGGRHRGQKRVADAVLADRRAHVLIQPADGLAGQVLLGVIERERPLFRGELARGEEGPALDRLHPGLGEPDRVLAAVARPAHDERVGEPGHAEADAPLGPGLVGLPGQGEARDVDDVVHHAHGHRDQGLERRHVEMGALRERIAHQGGQVDRTQITGPISRQGLLAAVVDIETVGVEGVDARNPHVVNVFETVVGQVRDPGEEPFPIGSAFVGRKQTCQSRLFVPIREADEFGEAVEVLVADDQIVQSFAEIGLGSPPAVRHIFVSGGTPFLINGRYDAQPEQHPLDRLESGEVTLGKPDANPLLLGSLYTAIGIEKTTQEATVEVA